MNTVNDSERKVMNKRPCSTVAESLTKTGAPSFSQFFPGGSTEKMLQRRYAFIPTILKQLSKD